MINKHHLLILIYALFLFSNGKHLFGQPINNQIQGVVMPPPDVASMGKYVDIPVSYFTGVPNISIPIHTIQDGPLSHPISLSYHASGVKLAEPASWVGLGWNLNGIGMVSRTVMGIPDDGADGYFSYAQSITKSEAERIDVGKGEKDVEPDIFSFNFNGFSGKFFFDKNDTIRFIPRQDLKIIPQKNAGGFLVGFTIFTPDGTRYIFGNDGTQTVTQEIMVSGTSDPAGGAGDHISSWYLLKIESFDKKHSISFHYSIEGYSYKYPDWCSAMTAVVYEGTGCSAPLTQQGAIQYFCDGDYKQTFVDGFRLDSITTSNQTTTVKFIADTLRTDLAAGDGTPGAKRLDEIQIVSGSYCKQVNFSYDYFVDNGTGLSGKPYAKRLKLNQVNISNCSGGDEIPPYKFEYYAAPQGSTYLPHRLSREVDHWGYYNGATVNNNLTRDFLIPSTEIGAPGSTYTIGGADRESDAETMKYGTLNKITYPTGGSAQFTFEANEVDDSLQHCVDTTLFSIASCDPISCANCLSSAGDTAIHTFTQSQLDNANYSMLLESIYFAIGDSCASAGNGYEYPDAEIRIWRVNTSDGSLTFLKLMSFGLEVDYSDPETCCKEYLDPLEDLYNNFQADSTYRFVISGFDGKATFKILSEDCVSSYPRTVGGLRIKHIRLNDTIENKEINRFFTYNQKNDDSKSSGQLINEPRYQFSVSGEGVNYYFSETPTPLSDYNGYSIGYSFVQDSIAGNGKTQHSFKFSTSSTGGLYPNPPVMPKFDNGQLIKTTTLDVNNNIVAEDSIVGITSSKYVNSAPAYKVYYFLICGIPTPDEIILSDAVEYSLREGFYLPKKKINVLDGVTTETNFNYDTTYRHLNPVSTSYTNSDGKLTKINLKYPHEMLDSYPGNDVWEKMVDSNIIRTSIEQKVIVNDEQIDGTRTHYTFFDPTSGVNLSTTDNGTMPYPHFFEKYERTWNSGGVLLAGAWDTIGIIDSIDVNNGFPKTFTQRGWEKESFEWDSSNDLIKKRTFEDFTWQYDYHNGTSMVSSITDVDGQVVNYEYDQLMRLEKIKAREDSIITDYEYNYYNGIGTYNSVETTITFHQTTGSGLNDRTTIQYLDGLGRSIQTVEKAYSENQKDVISAIEFDNIGRPFKVYETFESGNSNGNYVPKTSWPDTSLYTLTTYEASPLNRETGMRPPNWHFTTTDYSSNTSSLNLAGTSYSANTVFITTLTDPNGHKTISYKDKKGRDLQTIRRSSDGSNSVSTIYVYDDKDRVSKVLPPSTSLSNTESIYSYTYDERDNITSKKLPEQSAISYWYDERNLVTYMQDPNMADQGRWLHTQYDEYGRATASGFVTSAPGSGGTKANFTEALTRTYYDGYDFVGGAPAIYKGKVRKSETRILGTSDWLQTVFTYDDYGRVATSESNHHQNLGNTQADVINFTYDFADNITFQNRTHEYTSGYSTTIDERMVYDHSGRLTQNFHKVNGGTEVQLSEISYTAKDQIAQKNLGKVASSFLQSIDYTYRDNGFLSAINQPTLGGANMALGSCPDGTMPAPGAPTGTLDDKDLFYLQLGYDTIDASLSSSYKQYNGNISQISWRVRGRERQVYAFKYDYLDRLISSEYGDQADNNTIDWSAKRFNTFYEYDDRGNFTKLSRQGHYWDGSCWQTDQIDTLTYSYWNMITGGTSNRLRSVSDGAPSASRAEGFSSLNPGSDYDYDANGNMTYDPNKDMDVLYNYLNLPKRIEIEDCKFIEFLYDATGAKLRKTLKEGAMTIRTQDYIGGLEYTNDSLEAIYHSEGRVYFENGTSRYEFNITDHLGNTRLTFTDKDGDGVIEIFENADSNEVLSEHHYYPFGMQMEGSWMSNPGRSSKYQFNGIERDQDFNLNWDLATFRSYDPAIGRWAQVDPRINFNMSNYSGLGNNPIIFSDPLGDTTRVFDLTGQFLFSIDDTHANEDHFIGGYHLRRLQNLNDTGGDQIIEDNLGTYARKISKYYIGANTRAQLAEQARITELPNEEKERGFVLGLSGRSKELQVFDITDKVKYRTVGGLGRNENDVGSAVTEFSSENPNVTIIGWGHTHPSARLRGSSLSSDPVNAMHDPSASITEIKDFSNADIYNPYRGIYGAPNANWKGGNPSVIATKHGYSIYTAASETLTSSPKVPLQSSSPIINFNGYKIRN